MPPSLLESLPGEVKSEIFSHIEDLPTLRSFACSAPIINSHYQTYQKNILLDFIAHDLEGLWPDALAAYNSSHLSSSNSPRTKEKVTEFMRQYGEWVSSPKACPDNSSMPIEALKCMAVRHHNVMRPLAEALGKWARKKLDKALTEPKRWLDTPLPSEKGLMRSEEFRICRALYRHDTYHNLFGTSKDRGKNRFQSVEFSEVFLAPFTPWDAEALSCVDNFVRYKYKTLFSKIAVDPDHDGPLDTDHVQQYAQAFSFDYNLDAIVSRGLKTLATLLATQTRKGLIDKVPILLQGGNMRQSAVMETLHGLITQIDRRKIPNKLPIAADEAEQRMDIMSFCGDEDSEQAPWSWILLWNGLYANIHGAYVPERLQGSGLVFCDKEHWDGVDGAAFMKQEWTYDKHKAQIIDRAFGWSPPVH